MLNGDGSKTLPLTGYSTELDKIEKLTTLLLYPLVFGIKAKFWWLLPPYHHTTIFVKTAAIYFSIVLRKKVVICYTNYEFNNSRLSSAYRASKQHLRIFCTLVILFLFCPGKKRVYYGE